MLHCTFDMSHCTFDIVALYSLTFHTVRLTLSVKLGK
jgi:hypothetical protein